MPQWVQSLDGPELTKAIQTHIPEVLQHYKNDLYSFDVCNEVVGDDGSLRKSFWLDKLQDTFIETAFQAALDAGTNIKLYSALNVFVHRHNLLKQATELIICLCSMSRISTHDISVNDYNVESIGKKSDTLFKITQQLVAKKLIHGVGFQAHLIVGKIPSLEGRFLIQENLMTYIYQHTDDRLKFSLHSSPSLSTYLSRYQEKPSAFRGTR